MYYSSSSSQLAHDVQALLLRLGIISRISAVKQYSGRDQYHVKISGHDDIEQFIHQIGTVGKRRTAILAKIKTYVHDKKANTNRDIIPADIWKKYIVTAMEAQHISHRSFQSMLGNMYSGSSLFKANLSRVRALKAGQIVSSPEVISLAQSDVYWDQVVSVTLSGEKEVFDLTVAQHSNFVANNIVVHNSIEQDADVVMFLFRKDDDIREAVTLKIAKHRNGGLEDVELYFQGDRSRFYGLEPRRLT